MILRIVEAARPFIVNLSGPVLLGRQSPSEAEKGLAPLTVRDDFRDTSTNAHRLLIGWNGEPELSKRHVLVTPLSGGRVEVKNESENFEVVVVGREPIPKGQAVVLPVSPPVRLKFPYCTAVIEDESGDSGFHLDHSVGPAGLAKALEATPPPVPASPDQTDRLVEWLRTHAQVLQLVVASDRFDTDAVRAMVEVLRFRSGRLILRAGGRWTPVPRAAYPADRIHDTPSQTALAEVLRTGATVWQRPSARAGDSTHDREVIAAPLLGPSNEVIGVLYGEWPRAATVGGFGDQLHAVFVNALASGVSAGLARQEQAARADEQSARLALARARFSQFFTPELADQLARDPGMLEGRTENVSVLFADIRGYSRVSADAAVDPATKVGWVRDVMDTLSECVKAEGGVLVDYLGDELIAMWGAPTAQPNHPVRAARAGLAMIAALPALTAKWGSKINEEVRVGVGVNSGDAVVGNTGSKAKVKYGPLGHTVNLASRVQGLTKYLKVPFLVTADTRKQLGAEFAARRVVRTKVVNIPVPVDLFQVEFQVEPEHGAPARKAFLAESEAALAALEDGQFPEAVERAGRLLTKHPEDGPLRLILARASAMLMVDGDGFDPVWIPPGK